MKSLLFSICATLTLSAFAGGINAEEFERIKTREALNQKNEDIQFISEDLALATLEASLLKDTYYKFFSNEKQIKETSYYLDGALISGAALAALSMTKKPAQIIKIGYGALAAVGLNTGLMLATDYDGLVYELFFEKRVEITNKIEEMTPAEKVERMETLTGLIQNLREELEVAKKERDVLLSKIFAQQKSLQRIP